MSSNVYNKVVISLYPIVK